MYEYRLASVEKVVDGDTVNCTLDLGFGIATHFRFRLAGINAPELATPNGVAAQAFVYAWFQFHQDQVVVARTHPHGPGTAGIGDGAYGRWLAYFFALDDQGVTVSNLSSELLHAGLGVTVLNPWQPHARGVTDIGSRRST